MTKAPPPVYARTGSTTGAEVIDDRLLGAKLEAVEARTETKFAQLMGRMDSFFDALTGMKDDIREVKTRIDQVEEKAFSSKTVIITTIIGAFLGMAALVIGMLAYTVQLADFFRP